jgi:hypothetical protein
MGRNVVLNRCHQQINNFPHSKVIGVPARLKDARPTQGKLLTLGNLHLGTETGGLINDGVLKVRGKRSHFASGQKQLIHDAERKLHEIKKSCKIWQAKSNKEIKRQAIAKGKQTNVKGIIQTTN